MIGTYDFCGHYEWTFAWLEKKGGHPLLLAYMEEAISRDSQTHARRLIESEGFDGMMKYWGHTLAEESPERGYTMSRREDVVRFDMHDCPSKGFLIRNGLEQHRDYCDHCIQWIKPVMDDAGFVIDHEHNHCGQCWWEFRRKGDTHPASRPGELSGGNDVRLLPDWEKKTLDVFSRPDGPSQQP